MVLVIKQREYLAKTGNIVYGAGRRIESLENIKQVNPLKLDLTNEASIKTAIDTIIANEGRIDVLVNNAWLWFIWCNRRCHN